MPAIREHFLTPGKARPTRGREYTQETASLALSPDGMSPSSLVALQRAAGNQAAVQLIRNRGRSGPDGNPSPLARRRVQRQDSVVTFDSPEVVTGHITTLGPSSTGGTVATRCSNIAIQYERAVNLARDNADTALQNFESYMTFPAEAEAEADLVGVATKFALKEGFKALWDWAVKPIKAVPGVDKLADLMIALIEECERADAAAGRIKVRNWITEQRGHFQSSFDRTIRAMGDMGMNFERGYASAVQGSGEASMTGVANQPGQGKMPIAVGDQTLVGPGAEYLNKIAKAAEDGIARVPTWEEQLQDMLGRWVRRSENTLQSRGGGDIYGGGRIYLTVKLLREDGSYTVELPTAGHLASAEASRTGDALRRLLEDTDKNVNDLAILKVLKVQVEDEVWGFNDHYHTVLHYRQPDRIEFRGANLGPRVTTEYLDKANKIIPEALQQFNLSDINVRRLSSAADA